MSADAERGFLSRWSQRKALVREGAAVPAEPPAAPPVPLTSAPMPAACAEPAPEPAPAPQAPEQPPPLTLDDVATLTPESNYAPFVAREVQPEVRNAALKKLFADPQFNVMDGLDTYIDDYNKPDPLPPGMLRQMVQSQLLGLFADEPEKDQAAAEPQRLPPRDEDADLQLQPDDAARAVEPAPAEPGAGEDAPARGPGEH